MPEITQAVNITDQGGAGALSASAFDKSDCVTGMWEDIATGKEKWAWRWGAGGRTHLKAGRICWGQKRVPGRPGVEISKKEDTSVPCYENQESQSQAYPAVLSRLWAVPRPLCACLSLSVKMKS